jgi:hypothetical protein
MRFRKSGFVALAIAFVAFVTGATSARSDGALGVYFDTNGQQCSGDIPTASVVTLHVLLTPSGSTYGGIQGAEFRIEPPAGGGFLFQSVTAPSGAAMIGSAFGNGVVLGFHSCLTGSRPEVLSFQAFSSGAPATDAVLRVSAKLDNPTIFGCPVVALCDDPVYTAVCVEGEPTVLNPSGARACGSTRIDSQWSRVKDLYRP